MANNTEHGGISIELEHIFPIIKKWLYSEKEIFLREIVSNACDAVTKLRRLISLGEAKNIEKAPSRINVSLDSDAKTITVTDDGIGMTEEELTNYICKIALSGALDFIEKYEGESDAAASGIIGHFGLGFYSSFMVSDTVDVITRSYTDAPAVKWTCSDDGQYDIVTDFDDESYTEKSITMVAECDYEADKKRTQEKWEKFFAASKVTLEDKEIEKFYNSSLYHLAGCMGNKEFPPGLFGNFITDDFFPWAGDYHMNYNYEAPYYCIFSSNHPELFEGYEYKEIKL